MLIHRVVQDAATFRLAETAEGHAGVDGHVEMLLSQIDFALLFLSALAVASFTPWQSTLCVPTQSPGVLLCLLTCDAFLCYVDYTV